MKEAPKHVLGVRIGGCSPFSGLEAVIRSAAIANFLRKCFKNKKLYLPHKFKEVDKSTNPTSCSYKQHGRRKRIIMRTVLTTFDFVGYLHTANSLSLKMFSMNISQSKGFSDVSVKYFIFKIKCFICLGSINRRPVRLLESPNSRQFFTVGTE